MSPATSVLLRLSEQTERVCAQGASAATNRSGPRPAAHNTQPSTPPLHIFAGARLRAWAAALLANPQRLIAWAMVIGGLAGLAAGESRPSLTTLSPPVAVPLSGNHFQDWLAFMHGIGKAQASTVPVLFVSSTGNCSQPLPFVLPGRCYSALPPAYPLLGGQQAGRRAAASRWASPPLLCQPIPCLWLHRQQRPPTGHCKQHLPRWRQRRRRGQQQRRGRRPGADNHLQAWWRRLGPAERPAAQPSHRCQAHTSCFARQPQRSGAKRAQRHHYRSGSLRQPWGWPCGNGSHQQPFRGPGNPPTALPTCLPLHGRYLLPQHALHHRRRGGS